MGGKGGRVFRNIYKGHMDKTTVGWDQGWEVGMAGVGGVVGGKWREPDLNNNKKKCEKDKRAGKFYNTALSFSCPHK